DPPGPASGPVPAAEAPAPILSAVSSVPAADSGLTLSRDGLGYGARVQSTLLGRLRVTVKVTRGDLFHVDTLDLYASRSRTEFARRVSKAFTVEAASVETALLALLVEAEKVGEEKAGEGEAPASAMTETERAEALALLKRPDLLDQVARDI